MRKASSMRAEEEDGMLRGAVRLALGERGRRMSLSMSCMWADEEVVNWDGVGR